MPKSAFLRSPTIIPVQIGASPAQNIQGALLRKEGLVTSLQRMSHFGSALYEDWPIDRLVNSDQILEELTNNTFNSADFTEAELKKAREVVRKFVIDLLQTDPAVEGSRKFEGLMAAFEQRIINAKIIKNDGNQLTLNVVPSLATLGIVDGPSYCDVVRGNIVPEVDNERNNSLGTVDLARLCDGSEIGGREAGNQLNAKASLLRQQINLVDFLKQFEDQYSVLIKQISEIVKDAATKDSSINPEHVIGKIFGTNGVYSLNATGEQHGYDTDSMLISEAMDKVLKSDRGEDFRNVLNTLSGVISQTVQSIPRIIDILNTNRDQGKQDTSAFNYKKFKEVREEECNARIEVLETSLGFNRGQALAAISQVYNADGLPGSPAINFTAVKKDEKGNTWLIEENGSHYDITADANNLATAVGNQMILIEGIERLEQEKDEYIQHLDNLYRPLLSTNLGKIQETHHDLEIARARIILGLSKTKENNERKTKAEQDAEYKVAFEIFEKVNRENPTHGEAANMLAYCYQRGIGVKADKSKPKEIYKNLIDACEKANPKKVVDPKTASQYGKIILREELAKPFPDSDLVKEGLRRLRDAATFTFEQGSAVGDSYPEAEYLFARYSEKVREKIHNDNFVESNGRSLLCIESEVTKFLEKAAKKGNIDAAIRLAELDGKEDRVGKAQTTARNLLKVYNESFVIAGDRGERIREKVAALVKGYYDEYNVTEPFKMAFSETPEIKKFVDSLKIVDELKEAGALDFGGGTTDVKVVNSQLPGNDFSPDIVFSFNSPDSRSQVQNLFRNVYRDKPFQTKTSYDRQGNLRYELVVPYGDNIRSLVDAIKDENKDVDRQGIVSAKLLGGTYDNIGKVTHGISTVADKVTAVPFLAPLGFVRGLFASITDRMYASAQSAYKTRGDYGSEEELRARRIALEKDRINGIRSDTAWKPTTGVGSVRGFFNFVGNGWKSIKVLTSTIANMAMGVAGTILRVPAMILGGIGKFFTKIGDAIEAPFAKSTSPFVRNVGKLITNVLFPVNTIGRAIRTAGSIVDATADVLTTSARVYAKAIAFADSNGKPSNDFYSGLAIGLSAIVGDGSTDVGKWVRNKINQTSRNSLVESTPNEVTTQNKVKVKTPKELITWNQFAREFDSKDTTELVGANSLYKVFEKLMSVNDVNSEAFFTSFSAPSDLKGLEDRYFAKTRTFTVKSRNGKPVNQYFLIDQKTKEIFCVEERPFYQGGDYIIKLDTEKPDRIAMKGIITSIHEQYASSEKSVKSNFADFRKEFPVSVNHAANVENFGKILAQVSGASGTTESDSITTANIRLNNQVVKVIVDREAHSGNGVVLLDHGNGVREELKFGAVGREGRDSVDARLVDIFRQVKNQKSDEKGYKHSVVTPSNIVRNPMAKQFGKGQTEAMAASQ